MNIDAALAELSKLLYGYNYAVFLHRYSVPFLPDASAENYIHQALGSGAVVGGSQCVAPEEVLAEIEQRLRYAGDAGSGPRAAVLQSERFEVLLKCVQLHVTTSLSSATLIEQFWLREGHPDYPVFWDFAFVIAGPLSAEILLGSSSD